MRLVRVAVGLEVHRGADAFPGSNALVLPGVPSASLQVADLAANLTGGSGGGGEAGLGRGGARPNLTACRAACLEGGFGGFAVDQRDGTARFRACSPEALEANLRPAPGVDLYVLTVRDLGLKASAAGGATPGRRQGSARLDAVPMAPPLELWKCPPPDQPASFF